MKKVFWIWSAVMVGTLVSGDTYGMDSLAFRAKHNVDSLEEVLLKATGEDRLKVLKILNFLWRDERSRVGLAYAVEYDSLAKKLGDQVAMFWGQRMIGYSLSSLDDNYGAVGCYLECLRILDRNKGSKEIEGMEKFVRNNLGLAYSALGFYDEALVELGRAYELKKEEVPVARLSIASTLNNIGLIYYYLQAYDKAIRYFGLANRFHISTMPLYNSALCYLGKGLYENGKRYLDSALMVCVGEQCPVWMRVCVKVGYSNYYVRRGDFGLAELYLSEVIAEAKANDLKQYEEEGLVLLAETYFKTGKYERTREVLDQLGERQINSGKILYYTKFDSSFNSRLVQKVRDSEKLFELKGQGNRSQDYGNEGITLRALRWFSVPGILLFLGGVMIWKGVRLRLVLSGCCGVENEDVVVGGKS